MNAGEWIMALFGNSMALLVYFSIFAAGMTITLFKLIFGGDADHGDFHADHGDSADHDDGHGPGLFSVTGMVFMATGYGGTAFIIQYFSEKVVFSAIGGFLGAIPFAMFCISLYRIFLSQQASSLVKTSSLIGATGVVETKIPQGGVGEVLVSSSGRQFSRLAVSSSGEIPSGVTIQVLSIAGDRLVVGRLS